MISIRFIGVCCHIDPRDGKDKFGKRVVLTRGHDHSSAPHIPYVEIDNDDLVSLSFNDTNDTYTRDFTNYRKFVLDGEEVSIGPLDTSYPFEVVDTFHQLVPSMTKVAPELPREPRIECFEPTPDLIAGYFDMTTGLLLAGERELRKTRFVPQRDWPTQRNAFWTQLLVRLKQDAAPTITLRSIATGGTRKIQLKPDAFEITIGNQPLNIIEGIGTSPIAPREHFGMFYDLSPTPISSPPLPAETAPATNGCHASNWP